MSARSRVQAGDELRFLVEAADEVGHLARIGAAKNDGVYIAQSDAAFARITVGWTADCMRE